MKRGIFAVFIVLLLGLPFFAIAAEAPDTTPIQEKTNPFLEKEVQIPENLQIVARILFGLKPESPVKYNEFIIMISTFAIFFFLLKDIMKFVPLFTKGGISLIASIVVTVLIGTAGGYLVFIDEILFLGSFFGLLKDWKILTLAISMALLIALGAGITTILSKFLGSSEVEETKMSATKDSANIALAAKAARAQNPVVNMP